MVEEKEIVCSTNTYRVVKFDNKYVVEANKTFMNVWYPIKTYCFIGIKKDENVAKKCAYDYYIKCINK